MDVAAPNYVNTQIHFLLSILSSCVTKFFRCQYLGNKKSYQKSAGGKTTGVSKCKNSKKSSNKKICNKKMDFEWVTSRPEHPKVAMDGSKGLQLEIAAHVVLYVGLDGMSAPC